MSTLERCKAWIHWVGLEKEPGEDRALMAEDIRKLLAVVDAARDALDDMDRMFRTTERLEASLKDLDEARRG